MRTAASSAGEGDWNSAPSVAAPPRRLYQHDTSKRTHRSSPQTREPPPWSPAAATATAAAAAAAAAFTEARNKSVRGKGLHHQVVKRTDRRGGHTPPANGHNGNRRGSTATSAELVLPHQKQGSTANIAKENVVTPAEEASPPHRPREQPTPTGRVLPPPSSTRHRRHRGYVTTAIEGATPQSTWECATTATMRRRPLPPWEDIVSRPGAPPPQPRKRCSARRFIMNLFVEHSKTRKVSRSHKC